MTTSAPTTILRTVDKPRLRVIGEPIPTPRRPPNEQLRPREFLTAQEEPAIFALSRACIARGTGSSNPSPSTRESVLAGSPGRWEAGHRGWRGMATSSLQFVNAGYRWIKSQAWIPDFDTCEPLASLK